MWFYLLLIWKDFNIAYHWHIMYRDILWNPVDYIVD